MAWVLVWLILQHDLHHPKDHEMAILHDIIFLIKILVAAALERLVNLWRMVGDFASIVYSLIVE